MTNKTKAIVMANKALRQENRALWEENDLLRKGDEEMKLLYEAVIKQLVMLRDPANSDPIDPLYSVTLPKLDKEYLDRFILGSRATEDGMILKVGKVHDFGDEEEDDGEEH